MSNDADPAPDWEDLKDLIRWFVTLFGSPKHLYEDQVVRKSDGFVIRGWLAGLEAIARALLVTMAAGLPKLEATPPRPGKERAAKRAPARAVRSTANDIVVGDFEVPESERWADVRFVILPPLRSGRARRGAGSQPSGLMRTRPLAYRFEALIRVAKRPERYARRLAARLHAAPGLASRILRKPTLPIRCSSFPRRDVEDAQAEGKRASTVFAANTS